LKGIIIFKLFFPTRKDAHMTAHKSVHLFWIEIRNMIPWNVFYGVLFSFLTTLLLNFVLFLLRSVSIFYSLSAVTLRALSILFCFKAVHSIFRRSKQCFFFQFKIFEYG
jgi:hypothetical protein